MTAVVGILNKSAVAIAADSAVTFIQSRTNTTKILNRANKIFTLSKFHPVGTMIYNSANFMEVPWETIIKVYRAQLKDKCFDTLAEYQKDFIEFIKRSPFFRDVDAQQRALFQLTVFINNILTREVFREEKGLDLSSPGGTDKFQDILEQRADEYIAHFSGKRDYCDDFTTYNQADFFADYDIIFSKAFKYSFENHGIPIRAPLKIKLKELYFYWTISKEESSSYTGVVLTGYGELDIYASLIPLVISFGLGDKLRYHVKEGHRGIINSLNSAAICPFAQDDVISTILMGVHPKLEDGYKESFINFLDTYNNILVNHSGGPTSALAAQIGLIDKQTLIDEFNKVNQQIKQENFINPLLDAVSALSKEDLGEMAESLIYLTYLQRRITNAEESVGGPVDVAIISKGDGFIWLKRKHYFKPELNPQFFDNYYK